jgi:ubiquinone/menaquinone biosynthesis C-methylase UbiE
VSFDVAADAYDRFMGRYSVRLAPALADLAGVRRGQSALDVGCGPGALTGELVERLGADAVSAVDPSEPFVSAARERHPGVDVRLAAAENLPYPDATFDATLAQLVVHFMKDPAAGVAEMARVTRADGAVAASVWDFENERAPLSPFWRAARELDTGVDDESWLPGARNGQLRAYFEQAGLRDVEETEIAASVDHASFDEWWEPFTLGVGPAGAYARSLSADQLAAVRERCRELLPEGPFTLTTFAWAASGRV